MTANQTKPTSSSAGEPFISVLVPVRNEAACLGNVLDQLVAQDYPADRFEILVIDGRSTDSTVAIARGYASRFPQVRVLDNPERLSSAARNVGLRQSHGELLVIVDGHCDLGRTDYLRQVAEAFARSGADCLGRPQPLDVSGATLMQRAIAAARSSWLGHHPGSFIYSDQEQFAPAHSVAVAYRREVFDRVGCFDESFDACEDVELNHRLDRVGLRCLFTPAIAASYVPRSSLGGLFRQMARYGRGRVRLLRKHPDTFSLGSFAPAAWLGGLVLGPFTGLAWPPLWLVYTGAVGLYVLIVLAASLQIAWGHRDMRLLLLAPAVFATVHAGTGWGIVREVVAPRSRSR